MKVGDLVKPNLRVRKMRFLKGHYGIIIKDCTDPLRKLDPHSLVEWTDNTQRITSNRYIKVVINENR